jgi:Cilia- and flagella-associated protein 91
MEQQEMREFSLRESEIDAKREEKLRQLEEALRVRNESSEFFAAQKIEAIRQSKEAQREKAFEKIR